MADPSVPPDPETGKSDDPHDPQPDINARIDELTARIRQKMAAELTGPPPPATRVCGCGKDRTTAHEQIDLAIQRAIAMRDSFTGAIDLLRKLKAAVPADLPGDVDHFLAHVFNAGMVPLGSGGPR